MFSQGAANNIVNSQIGATAAIALTKLASTTSSFVQPADQTGNATATLKMNGYGAAASPTTFTPSSTGTGRVLVIWNFDAKSDTSADGVAMSIRDGTGAAPANAGAATGTIRSSTFQVDNGTGVGIFHVCFAYVAALTAGTTYWFDVAISNVTGGTANLFRADFYIQELI